MNKKRGYLQISFAWLFAIIAGAVILFLAIYGVTKLISTEEDILNAKTGKEIGVLLNPLETGFETGKVTSLTMPVESRIYARCKIGGNFGKQTISVSQQSFNKWTETNLEIDFENKYIFAEIPVEGKKFYLFSKPFKMPFKIADLIYIAPSSEKYCFLGLEDSGAMELEDIKDELVSLNQGNILIENCSEQEEIIKVCFSSGKDCDINVNYGRGIVQKKGETMYFETDALMYGAIFSDENIYECQIKRLMMRTEELALLYKDKAVFVARTGCNSNLNTDLMALSNSANSLRSSSSLSSIAMLADDIKNKNDLAQCKLW